MITIKYTDNSTKKFDNFKDIFDDNQVNIIYLNCTYNQLKEIPKEIGNLINLKSFYCYNNKLINLPLEIINCVRLRSLHFNDNEIINLNPIVQRFIDRMNGINNHNLYNDGQNIHTSSIQESIKESIMNLLKDEYT